MRVYCKDEEARELQILLQKNTIYEQEKLERKIERLEEKNKLLEKENEWLKKENNMKEHIRRLQEDIKSKSTMLLDVNATHLLQKKSKKKYWKHKKQQKKESDEPKRTIIDKKLKHSKHAQKRKEKVMDSVNYGEEDLVSDGYEN